MAKATAVRVSTGKKFSQLLIITPAVAIDNNNDGGYNGPFTSHDSGCGSSGAGSDASLDESDGGNPERIRSAAGDRKNNNDKSNRLKLLPKAARQHIVTKVSSVSMGGCGGGGGGGRDGSATQSWRWCSIICSAVRCFRAATHTRQHFGTIHYTANAGTVDADMGPGERSSVRNPLTSGRIGSGGRSSSRFSSSHIYEYTIKSYRSRPNDHDLINNNSGNHSGGGGDSTDRSNIMYKL